MEAFAWSRLFETGLPDVDEQHKRLVELVNQLGRDTHSGSEERIDATLKALAEYTVYHFECEEGLMTAAGVAPGHADRHKETHRRFIAQVVEWLDRRKAGEPISLAQLIEFLANWLVFHILGDDQSMGRQVLAIRSGMAPQLALNSDRTSDDPRTDILLSALRRLYSGLVRRNEELIATQNSLAALNASLEQRVRERTAELEEANRRLREEQEKLLEAEKMASLGRMVAGFAHEVNTPVGVAVGAASQSRDLLDQLERMLTQEEVEEDELKQCIGSLDEAADLTLSNLHRAAGLVKSFKRTAVDQASETERAYDLVEIIEDVQKSLAGSFRNTAIDFEVSCPAAIELYGPAGAATQLLTNLVQNSRMHGFADGTLPGHIRLHAGVDGEQVCIDYSDDGAGMSEECLAHAFEPFFTTRRGSGGSGLGLYIAYNLVTRSLGGTIRCSSQPGKGVQFSIHYPVRRSRAQTGSS